jgi:hypothetical protein
MNKRFLSLFLTSLTGLTLLSGCARKDYQPGFVYRDWSLRMSEMGIYPIFPPREDVVVGDVYLLPTHPYDSALLERLGGLGNAGLHIYYFDKILAADRSDEYGVASDGLVTLDQVLLRHYKSRPSLPDTIAVPDLTGIPKLTGIPDPPTPENVFSPQVPIRTRQVGFPEFTVTTVDEGALAALVPIEAFSVNLGFSYANVSRISFKVPQAESYALTTDRLLTGFLKDNILIENAPGAPRYFLRAADADHPGLLAPYSARLARSHFNEAIGQALSRLAKRSPMEARKLRDASQETADTVYLAVIQEVFYARSIDISIGFRSGRAFRGEVEPFSPADLAALDKIGRRPTAAAGDQPEGEGEGEPEPPAAEEAEEPAVPASPALVDVQADDDAFEMARKLRELNLGQTTHLPGGSMSVISVADRTIGLRRTFERPIAVGARGTLLRLRVNPIAVETADGTVTAFEIDLTDQISLSP